MNYKRFEGRLDASGVSIGIVVSRFNNFFTEKLLEGAIDCLVRHGGSAENISVAWVPGAFEVPYAAQKMASSGDYNAVICLGAVVRGDTPHFNYIANESAKGIAKLGMDSGIPVIYGLVTADTLEQAVERSGTKAGNKGWDAAEAAIEMINLYKALD
ncbi:6,7-dimethyl-8-ribityllumazine synthase [candidate division GN15 bacterium]|nr:6,7-dimethyl-8-ribityllumazine synthase [candidate division GN15 bacterium]